MGSVGTDQTMLDVITQRLEIGSVQRIKEKIQKKETIKGYWGTAPTGKPHIGYLVPLVKIAECIASGVEMTLLVADSYGFMVNYDVPLHIVNYRSRYYTFLLASLLEALGIDAKHISIMQESDYSMTPAFIHDSMRLCSISTQADIKSVGLEVSTTPMMSPLLCPIHQALSEVYTESDFQLGGLDQTGMFDFADKQLPKLGYRPSDHLAAAMVPGLDSKKMSSSAHATTKITFFDSDEMIDSKLEGADTSYHGPMHNAILACAKHILFPIYQMRTITTGTVELQQPDGTSRLYGSYEAVEEDVLAGRITMDSLRVAVADILKRVLSPVRREFKVNKMWQEVERLGYADDTNGAG